MAGKGSPPGVRQGGRQKGTPNKVTADARETFRLVFENLAPEAEGWIRAAAKKSPAKGAELLLRMAEHFVPRLSRGELSGPDGEPLIIELSPLLTQGKAATVDASDVGEAADQREHGAPGQSRPTTSVHQAKLDIVPGIRPNQWGAGAPCAMPRIGDRGISPELSEAMRRRSGL